jgi:copper transport protein
VTIRGWRAVAVGLGVLLIGAGPGLHAESVLAHAVLLRTIPSSSQTLPQAPAEVRLLFSEPIDMLFSSVHVNNAAGQLVDKGDARVDPDDDHQLVVSLQPTLPNGVYTVAWRSLSTIDVHPDQGTYSLFVGVPVATAAPPGASGITLTGTTPETTLGRWWFYLSASLFGGVLAVWKLVIGPVLADGPAEARAAVHRRAHRLIVLGGVLLVLGTLFTAVAQAAAAADVPLQAAIGQPLSDLLLRGRFAAIWWPRIGLEVASLMLIAFAGLEGLAADCALATLPGVLLTSGLTSHGAALPAIEGVGIAIDWLHIVGATAWVGGLIGVLICLPVLWRPDLTQGDAHAVPSRLMARFSRFALAASAMVVLSGIVQAVFEVGSWSALVETGYGEMVLVKVALLGAMLLLAAFSTRHSRMLVTSSAAKGVQMRLLRRSVRAELVLGVVVLAVAAVLTGTPPDRSAPPAATGGQPTASR